MRMVNKRLDGILFKLLFIFLKGFNNRKINIFFYILPIGKLTKREFMQNKMGK